MTGTVLVLPADDAWDREVGNLLARTDLVAVEVHPVAGPEAALSARICAAISQLAVAPPLHVVAFGPAALFLPSVGLAQRTARRRIVEYVLVDPQVPPVSDSWPDAPVTAFVTDLAARSTAQVRLRGWQVEPAATLPAWRPLDGWSG